MKTGSWPKLMTHWAASSVGPLAVAVSAVERSPGNDSKPCHTPATASVAPENSRPSPTSHEPPEEESDGESRRTEGGDPGRRRLRGGRAGPAPQCPQPGRRRDPDRVAQGRPGPQLGLHRLGWLF